MNPLVREKERAVRLRKRGYTYRDILKEVRVAKSSLSLWLKELPLTHLEKQYLKDRKDSNITRGRIRAATSNHVRRLVRDKFLLQSARQEFDKKIRDPFFAVGVALYWAEGAKRSPSFSFMNSDPDMVVLMLSWIRKFLDVSDEEIGLRLYVHKAYLHENCEVYWSRTTRLPFEHFKKTIVKKSISLVKRRPNYRGCVRIELMKVRHLRRMQYWRNMLVEYYKKAG